MFYIAGVKIVNPVSKGSYDFEENAWPLAARAPNKATYEVDYSTSAKRLGLSPISLMDSVATDPNDAMLLSQELKARDHTKSFNDRGDGRNHLGLKIKILKADAADPTAATQFRLNTGVGEDQGWVAVPIGTKWKMGYKMHLYSRLHQCCRPE